MGNFRKIHTIPQRAFQDCKDRGAVGRGHLRTGNLKAWGKLMSGILNALWGGGGGGWGGGLDLEFPQGQTRVYSLKMLFSWT